MNVYSIKLPKMCYFKEYAFLANKSTHMVYFYWFRLFGSLFSNIFQIFKLFWSGANTFFLWTASCVVARNGEKISCTGENTIAFCVLSSSFEQYHAHASVFSRDYDGLTGFYHRVEVHVLTYGRKGFSTVLAAKYLSYNAQPSPLQCIDHQTWGSEQDGRLVSMYILSNEK
jgi:hypothetical protein